MTVVVLDAPSPHTEKGLELEPPASIGADVEVFDAGSVQLKPRGRLAQVFSHETKDFYPWVGLRTEVGDLLKRIDPDVILAYEVAVLAAIPPALGVPVVAATVDLDHLSNWLRFEHTPVRPSPGYVIESLRARHDKQWRPAQMVSLLKEANAVVNFAAHHAEWLRSKGVDCKYLRTPVPDPGRTVRKSSGAGPMRLLLMGHMRGLSTQLGLKVFGSEVLPNLRDIIGSGFEVRIVGAFPDALPAEVRKSLDASEVEFAGYVDDIAAEFAQADIFIAPTPVELGTRVRIVVAMSYGCCIVAHEANAKGIPELQDGVNALLAGSEGLTQAIQRAAHGPNLREHLGREARLTYEKNFAPEIAADELIDLLKARGRSD